MSLLPASQAQELSQANLQEIQEPTYTHYWDVYKNRVRGHTDELEAMRQAVHLILHVERYKYPIYSRNFGIELNDLMGKPQTYAVPELKRRVEEALLWDDRITGVSEWEVSHKRDTVIADFTVHTIFGNLRESLEVHV
jgi:phage baseplate assembly protein W